MSAMGKAMMMEREAGVMKPSKTVRRFDSIFWRRVGFALDGRATADSEVKDGRVGLAGITGGIGCSPWTIVGAGEAKREAKAPSECVGTMVVPSSGGQKETCRLIDGRRLCRASEGVGDDGPYFPAAQQSSTGSFSLRSSSLLLLGGALE